MKKILFRTFIILILLIAGVAATAYFWYQNGITQPVSNSTETVSFSIKTGQSFDTIGNNLLESKLIADKNLYLIYGKINPTKASAFQAGEFLIPANVNIMELFEVLQKAKNKEDIKVTIPEGLRYDEIINIVTKTFKNADNFDKTQMTAIVENPDDYTFTSKVQSFLDEYKPKKKNLEGFLYPDTYYFAKDSDAKQIVEKLISTLISKLSDKDVSAIKSSNYSLYQILTIASMLERETITTAEQPMVADVIIKRLEKGIQGIKLLQIDATIAYPYKDWSINVFPLLTKDTPYNTYMRPGLTPTPIANPGITTIRASIYPESNEYYYYIHDKQGIIHYAKNLGQHESNIAKYL